MKIKIKQLVDAIEPLAVLLNKELPIKASYQLGKLKSGIESELNQFEIERQKLIKKYGKEKEDGTVSVEEEDKENYDKFIEEINQLFDVEVDINYSPIKIDMLGNITITPNHLLLLNPFLSEE